ncbi:phage minor head protein [uncultured Deefgea sp.]|uniref:phage head morphogenesis protein n=1 Tax=uncultured Deefgea sp. TaxID=1304914 RepID=UPI00262C0A96|nr:phage minor head protein [uncultured Deefgea sp.]
MSPEMKAVFGMEPEAAVKYLQSKGYRISWNWHEMLDEAHARAFTVAKCARLDVLQDIRGAVTKALQSGQTLEQFKDALTPTLQAKGWWGKQVIVDGAGNAEMVQLGSSRRLKTIYQTNLQSSYMAGRYQQMKSTTDDFPFWRYVAILDGRTRPSHRAMNGRVFRHDDGLWDSSFPPNGFNCRCRVQPLTQKMIDREGAQVESSAGRMQTVEKTAGTDKRTGEVVKVDVPGIKVTGAEGQPHIFAPDVGFASSPAASHALDDLLYQKAVTTLPNRAMALQEVQQTLLSPVRRRAWKGFVDTAISSPYAMNKSMAVGVLAERDLQFVEARGITPVSGVIYVEDRMFVGPKAERHARAGNALTRAEWIALPDDLTNAQVLWDTKNQTLLYVVPSQDGRESKLVIAFNRFNKPTDLSKNQAASAFKVTAADIESGIKNGQYERVR